MVPKLDEFIVPDGLYLNPVLAALTVKLLSDRPLIVVLASSVLMSLSRNTSISCFISPI